MPVALWLAHKAQARRFLCCHLAINPHQETLPAVNKQTSPAAGLPTPEHFGMPTVSRDAPTNIYTPFISPLLQRYRQLIFVVEMLHSFVHGRQCRGAGPGLLDVNIQV